MQFEMSHFVDDVREGLAVLVDLILPGTDRLPPGREVGAHRELLDQVLTADPGLTGPIFEAGQRVLETGCASLRELQEWETGVRETVVFALTSAYYMSRQVQRALHYPGPGPHPIAFAKPDQVCTDDLLAPVRKRGSVYVEAPQ